MGAHASARASTSPARSRSRRTSSRRSSELGELDEALAVTRRLRELASGRSTHGGSRPRRAAARSCNWPRGYDDDAAAALEQAAAEYLRLGLPLRPRARRCSASAGRSGGSKKWGAARELAGAAAAAFEELGSPGWAEGARSELARVGARRPQASGELTATERRVAELAADGMSNKEIARTLFVGVHTVEVHLSHAYAKLGVHSRSQLARRLADATSRH